MRRSKCCDLGVKLLSFTLREFWRGIHLDRLKLCSCPPGGDHFPLMSKRALLFGCVPAREPSAYCIPTVPCGTPTVMWTSFCCLRYVGTLQGQRKSELLVTVNCARAREKTLPMPFTYPQLHKKYIYILTFQLT